MSQEQPPTEEPPVLVENQMSRTESLMLRMGTAGELLSMFIRGGRWWMLPMLMVFILLGLILVLLQSASYVAPFIYMVF